MTLIVRGIVWFGLYLFLILLPLATAAIAGPATVSPGLIGEIGVGVGFVGLALMCLEFALREVSMGARRRVAEAAVLE